MSTTSNTTIRDVITNPRAYIALLLTAIKELLVEPEEFFEQRVGTSGYNLELLLLAVTGLIGTIGMVYAIQTLLDPFSTGTGIAGAVQGSETNLDSTTTRRLWGNAVRPFFEVFVLWIIYTTAFYLLSWLYTERGSYGHLLKVTAWGFLPYAFYNAIHSLGLFGTFYGLDVDTEIPTGTTEQIMSFLLDQGFNEPLVAITGMLGVIFLAWCAYIWIPAVQQVRELPRSAARYVVAIPVAIHAVYLLWTYGGRLL